MTDILEKDSEEKIDLETLLTIGARQEVSGKKIPQPTLAALSMLEMRKSPYLVAAESVKIAETMEALYILFEPKAAMQSLLMERKGMEGDFIFDALVWAQSFGNINHAEAASCIAFYIKMATAGYDLIPDDGKGKLVKKKDTIAGNG